MALPLPPASFKKEKDMACIMDKSDLMGLCLENNCSFFDRATKLCVYISPGQRGHGRGERINAANLMMEPPGAEKPVKKRKRKREKVKK